MLGAVIGQAVLGQFFVRNTDNKPGAYFEGLGRAEFESRATLDFQECR